MTVRVIHDDCLQALPTLGANVFDSVVCDPPYHLTSIVKRFGGDQPPRTLATVGKHAYGRHAAGFMGKAWDGGDIAFRVETWRAVYDTLKPGGYLIAFASTRGYHRMVCAIEDAGFIIHPMIGWIFGSGFPKATNLGKQLDRANGATRATRRAHNIKGGNLMGASQGNDGGVFDYNITEAASDEAKAWDGWSYGAQSLKPALEPICMAQKPIDGKRMIDNVRKWGVGAVNIDACRVGTTRRVPASHSNTPANIGAIGIGARRQGSEFDTDMGRWPANLCHDGSDEVSAAFPETPGQLATVGPQHGAKTSVNTFGDYGPRELTHPRGDAGSAARFFYSAKADADDRCDSRHPTVKPVQLVRWLCRLVTPPGGHVLDCFGGSGTTAVACIREGFDATLIEREAEYVSDIHRRLGRLEGKDTPLFGPALQEAML